MVYVSLTHMPCFAASGALVCLLSGFDWRYILIGAILFSLVLVGGIGAWQLQVLVRGASVVQFGCLFRHVFVFVFVWVCWVNTVVRVGEAVLPPTSLHKPTHYTSLKSLIPAVGRPGLFWRGETPQTYVLFF